MTELLRAGLLEFNCSVKERKKKEVVVQNQLAVKFC